MLRRRKSAEWEAELREIRGRIGCHEHADFSCYHTGVQILELVKNAYDLCLQQPIEKERRLLNTLLSNCYLDRVSLHPAYKKPFGILAEGVQNRGWRGPGQPDLPVLCSRTGRGVR